MEHKAKCGCEILTADNLLFYCPVHAAAPALLAALERISNGPATIDESTSPETMLATIRDIVTQAATAIQQAKGETND